MPYARRGCCRKTSGCGCKDSSVYSLSPETKWEIVRLLQAHGGRYADLRVLDLEGADLSGVILTGADLRGANLRSANLADTSLRAARLEAKQ